MYITYLYIIKTFLKLGTDSENFVNIAFLSVNCLNLTSKDSQ